MMLTTLHATVAKALGSTPKWLPFQYLYDARGSALYEEITRLEAYYPTRTEEGILAAHAEEVVAAAVPFQHMVELGSGSARKTRHLLRRVGHNGQGVVYHPVDISTTALDGAVKALRAEMPALEVRPHPGEYTQVLDRLDADLDGPRFVVLLGSSIGNFDPPDAARFLASVRRLVAGEGAFLVGTDMVKDAAVLERAYDDPEGVTAAFNLNLLVRLNRELGGRFDVEAFAHRAVYVPEKSRIEMHLVSLRDQEVPVEGLGRTFRFRRGETIHTENSYKFTPASVARLAAGNGFRPVRSWFDDRGWFGLHVWRAA